MAVFLILTFLTLITMNDDSFHIFPGVFHLVRWARGIDAGPFTTYLQAACRADQQCAEQTHAYFVRTAVGFAYPLLAVLYAGIAELMRSLLPSDVTYAELLVRAGNLTMIAHWVILMGLLAVTLWKGVDKHLRPNVAAAAFAILSTS